MRRKFSNREKLLLVVLSAMILFCLYYLLVDQPVRDALISAQERQENAQMELELQSVRLKKHRAMKAALATLDPNAQNEVPDFDNVRNVTQLLNRALAFTDDNSWNLNSRAVTFSGAIACRPFDISFTCDSYATAKHILSILTDSGYRCRILSLSVSGSGDIRANGVSVGVSLAFYEYLTPELRAARAK